MIKPTPRPEFAALPIEPLIGAPTIATRVKELGAEITRDYRGLDLVVVGVLKGAFVFLADLVRAIDVPIECDFIAISSYGDALESSGEVRLAQPLRTTVAGRHVLLVEDIVDTGRSLDYLVRYFGSMSVASCACCALLRRAISPRPEALRYFGFEVANDFVVGYGLDAAGRYRELPFVGRYTGATPKGPLG